MLSLVAAAALAATGQFKQAREVGHALLRVNPTHAFKDADKRRLFGDHLVLAGLPE
jgi:adenylate cyclase